MAGTVYLTPEFRRLDGNLTNLIRGDLVTTNVISYYQSNHQIVTATAAGNEVSSGFPNALLEYFIVYNKSDYAVTAEVWLNNHPLTTTRCTIPAHQMLVLRDVNYAALRPILTCTSGDAECEVLWFGGYNDGDDFDQDMIVWQAGECTFDHEPAPQ